MAITRLKPILVVNCSGEFRKFRIDHEAGVEPELHNLAPGESVEVPGAYAARRQTGPGRDLMPSIIENLTGGLVKPAFDPEAKAVLARVASEKAAASAAAEQAKAATQGKQAR